MVRTVRRGEVTGTGTTLGQPYHARRRLVDHESRWWRHIECNDDMPRSKMATNSHGKTCRRGERDRVGQHKFVSPPPPPPPHAGDMDTSTNDVRGGGRSRAWPALRPMANHGHTQHGLGWPLAAVTTAAAAAVVCDTIAMLTMFQTPSTLQGCRCMKSVCRVGARGSTPSLGPILSPATRRGQNHPATRT